MESGVASFKDLAELLSYIAIILGIPAAIFQYAQAVRKEQRDRESASYEVVEDKYFEFQRLCLAYPRLDVWDLPHSEPMELSAEEKKQELIAFTLLLSIFQRGFLMHTAMSPQQWTGLRGYIQITANVPTSVMPGGRAEGRSTTALQSSWKDWSQTGRTKPNMTRPANETTSKRAQALQCRVTRSAYSSRIRQKTGPGLPSPIRRPSISETGVCAPNVPVRNASSAP